MLNEHIADIQSSPDPRNFAVNRVGIRGIRHPMTFEDFDTSPQAYHQSTVAHFEMLVDLPKNIKGTHMSRFIEMLNEQDTVLSIATLPSWLKKMVSRLNANDGYFQAQFPLFVKKYAPVSNAISWMDYDICLQGIFTPLQCHTLVRMIIPVTSLCPCSKKIAEYGAHNQRSHVCVTLRAKEPFSLIQMIQLVESKASCELFALLKRPDEKMVTERAYDNPKFVEDMVRDIATTLETLDTILGYKVSSENFESIHNHSAFAEIDKLWVKEKKENIVTAASTFALTQVADP